MTLFQRKRMLKVSRLCCHCDCALTLINATIEHIIPRSQGGCNLPWNLTLACFDCNTTRQSAEFFTWRQWSRGEEEDIWEGRDFYEDLDVTVANVEPAKSPPKPRCGQAYRALLKLRRDTKTAKRVWRQMGMESARLHAMC